MKKPTDDQVLSVVGGYRAPTYYYRNVLQLNHGFKGLKTDFVRRALMRLEKAGKVQRVETHYAVMICWALAPANKA